MWLLDTAHEALTISFLLGLLRSYILSWVKVNYKVAMNILFLYNHQVWFLLTLGFSDSRKQHGRNEAGTSCFIDASSSGWETCLYIFQIFCVSCEIYCEIYASCFNPFPPPPKSKANQQTNKKKWSLKRHWFLTKIVSVENNSIFTNWL